MFRRADRSPRGDDGFKRYTIYKRKPSDKEESQRDYLLRLFKRGEIVQAVILLGLLGVVAYYLFFL